MSLRALPAQAFEDGVPSRDSNLCKAANAGPASDKDAASMPVACVAVMQKQLAAPKFGIAAYMEAASGACIPLRLILAALKAEECFWVQCEVALDGQARAVYPAAVAGGLYAQPPCEDRAAREAHGCREEKLGASTAGRPQLGLGLASRLSLRLPLPVTRHEDPSATTTSSFFTCLGFAFSGGGPNYSVAHEVPHRFQPDLMRPGLPAG